MFFGGPPLPGAREGPRKTAAIAAQVAGFSVLFVPEGAVGLHGWFGGGIPDRSALGSHYKHMIGAQFKPCSDLHSVSVALLYL